MSCLAARMSLGRDLTGAPWTTNVLGARNVVEAALQYGVRRLAHFFSMHAFNQFPLNEGRDLATGAHVSPYGRSKAQGEKEFPHGVERGLDAVTLHPTAWIGPFDHKLTDMGRFFWDRYRRKIPAPVAGGFDCVAVRDVVDATLAAGSRGRCGENDSLSEPRRSRWFEEQSYLDREIQND